MQGKRRKGKKFVESFFKIYKFTKNTWDFLETYAILIKYYLRMIEDCEVKMGSPCCTCTE